MCNSESGIILYYHFSFSGYLINFKVDNADLETIAEGRFIGFSLAGSGFSYGNIPVLITPLPCSDYNGNLTALFDNVPPASAHIGAL